MLQRIKFINHDKIHNLDEITFEYFDRLKPINLFDISNKQYETFRKKLEEKNWMSVATELFYEKIPWLFRIITNQNRSDFIFLLDIKKNDLALDLGAGWGQVTIPLSKFCNVVAVEGNKEKIEIIKKIAQQENRKNIQYVVANINDKIFDKNQFNFVILNGVLEWAGAFSEGDPIKLQENIIREAYELLKPGGSLYIGIENKYGLKYLLGEKDDHTGLRDMIYLEQNSAKEIYEAETGKKLRVFTHSKDEYEKMLRSSGFKKIEFFGDLPDYKLPKLMINLSDDSTSSFFSQKLDFVDEYEGEHGSISAYNEKLKKLYSIFSSSELTKLYPSYSIIAQK